MYRKFHKLRVRFAECELRSAGPNWTPGYVDDVDWTGKEPE